MVIQFADEKWGYRRLAPKRGSAEFGIKKRYLVLSLAIRLRNDFRLPPIGAHSTSRDAASCESRRPRVLKTRGWRILRVPDHPSRAFENG
jgi:hypothetical protein